MEHLNTGKLQRNYMVESLSPDMGYFFKSSNVLFKIKTDYQDLEVHDVDNYGRILRLDGVFQTSERDEFLYHEPLAHVPGITMDGPESALVIGGGDGGAIEEILKYPTAKRVVMVELDQGVVDASIKYIPSISNGAFDSPYVDLKIEDGIKYIKDTKEKFDHVLLDLTDPFGPSVALYTREFYSSVNNILSERGALTLHIESPITRPEVFATLYWTLKSVFKVVRPMLNYVPMYGTLWGYAMASQKYDPMDLTPEKIKERIEKFNLKDLKYYTPETHRSLLTLPPYIQSLINKERKPFTENNLPQIGREHIPNLHIATDE